MTWLVPPEYVVLDIETTAGDPTEAEEWMRRAWAPSPKWKPATIGSRFLDAYEKKQERLALLDTAPIISVTLLTAADFRVLHWLPCDGDAAPGVPAERLADQTAMLRRAAEYLGSCDADTVLVGHNVLKFDLPKLRQAMIRHAVALPACLVWRDHPVYDTMREWSRFTLDDRQYIGLGELLETCGLIDPKQVVSGAMVPELYAQERYREILAYAVADVLAESALFRRMTGRSVGEAADPHRAEAEAAAREVAAGPNGTTPTVAEAAEAATAVDTKAVDTTEALIKEFQS